MHGYAGKTLVIDLGSGAREIRENSPDDCRKFIGGAGLNIKTLLAEMDPALDAFDEKNVLVFGAGPLVGTNAPTASRSEVSAKSPLTGLLATSNSGYFWGPELKYAGYDSLILKGKSERPVYIYIKDGEVDILDASKLWGSDAWETIREIKSAHDRKATVACIGVGGEKLARYASIENGMYGAWGRTGLGAVMGSKNLKAVAVRGTGDITVADPKGYREAVKDMRAKIAGHITYKPWRQFGSMLGLDIYYALGVISGLDQSDSVGADFIETLGKNNLLKYKKKGLACSACPIACAPWVEIAEGPYKGLRIKGIEIISTLDFGARLGIRSMPAIARATELFQKYGVDCSTMSAAIALAIKLFEQGVITKADTDGMELKWGDEPSIFELMRKAVYREGLGDLLAEGPVRMAQKIGRGAEEFLTQTRGLETTARDPRGRWDTWSFGSLINPRGGDHLRVQAQAENFKDTSPEGEYLYEQGIPKKAVDPVDILPAWKEKIFDFEKNTISIPHMAAWAQDHMNVVNSIGVCIRPPILWSLGPTIYARLLETLTGLPFTPEEVMKAGERISAAARRFNAAAGERREDIRFTERYYKVPFKGRKLDREKINQVLDRYYEVRGWDPATAQPTPEKLKDLGLEK